MKVILPKEFLSFSMGIKGEALKVNLVLNNRGVLCSREKGEYFLIEYLNDLKKIEVPIFKAERILICEPSEVECDEINSNAQDISLVLPTFILNYVAEREKEVGLDRALNEMRLMSFVLLYKLGAVKKKHYIDYYFGVFASVEFFRIEEQENSSLKAIFFRGEGLINSRKVKGGKDEA